MGEYSKLIDAERLVDVDSGNHEFIVFINELFERMGFSVIIQFHDDWVTGDRTLTAKWKPIREGHP